MKINRFIILILGATLAWFLIRTSHSPVHPPDSALSPVVLPGIGAPSAGGNSTLPNRASAPVLLAVKASPSGLPAPSAGMVAATNKAGRLAEIRERFHALAAGKRLTAILAAREIKDDVEREAALMTLATEWTGGELRSPQDRARDIAQYGLEAGIGRELAKDPALALLWAEQLPGAGEPHDMLLRHIAAEVVNADPAAAFAMMEQVAPTNRAKLTGEIFEDWATRDTAASLQYAEQLPDPGQRDAALQAIRGVAPVGIGAALRMEDGYPVVNQVMTGTPADLSGQLHPGDRIIGIAQGDNRFVDAHGASLADTVQMIRGAPNTVLQLQIIPAGASPDAPPQTIAILRDQIKYKK